MISRSWKKSNDVQSLVYGLLGVVSFSLTLPASRVAVVQLDPIFVGVGRALVAAVFAILTLWLARSEWPSRKQWLRLYWVAAGIVLGFPLLSTLAMTQVAASHGAVVVGLLPLATALFGCWLANERPSRLFWVATLVGSVTIAVFSLGPRLDSLHPADLLLLGAVVAAGFGYAEGARLARELGAWQTICWALIASIPILLWPTYQYFPQNVDELTFSTLLSFGYVSIVSMFLGFFAWYKGLAMGGIARIGQLQLLQPFLTLAASAALLSEQISFSQILAATIVIASVYFARKAAINVPQTRSTGAL